MTTKGKFIHRNIIVYGLILIIITCFLIFFGFKNKCSAQDAQTYYQNGYQYFSQENYQKAEENYQKAIEIDPNFENAHYWLGKVYRQTGQYEKAIPQWIEVLRINPRNTYAFRYLNGSFNNTSRVKSNLAGDYFSEGLNILGIEENSIFLHSNNINNYTLLTAVPYLEKAVEIGLTTNDAQYWVAQVYQALSKKISWQYTSLAINSYEKFIDLEEKNKPLSFERTQKYWNSYQELMQIFDSLGLNERKENLVSQVLQLRSIPYSQVLQESGYYDFGYPDSIEIIVSNSEELIELWRYEEEEKVFRIINKKVIGEEDFFH